MPTDNGGAGSFDPSATYNASTSTTSSSTIALLPDNNLDLYGLGAMANQGIYTGVASGYDGPKGKEVATEVPQYAKAYQIVENAAKLSATDKNSFANLQAQLYYSGYYSGKPTTGVFTAKDGDALSEALRGYLAVSQTGVPISFSEWLSDNAGIGRSEGGPAGGTSGGSGAATRAPLQLTSSGTLAAEVNTEAQQDLGRNYDAGEQQGFINKYHGQEQAQYNGSAEAAGDPTAEAKTFVDTNNNAEMQTHLQAGYAERMLSMLGVQSG